MELESSSPNILDNPNLELGLNRFKFLCFSLNRKVMVLDFLVVCSGVGALPKRKR